MKTRKTKPMKDYVKYPEPKYAEPKAKGELARPTPTPSDRPWSIENGMIIDAHGLPVFNVGNNTELIVRAVNSHEELLNALRQYVKSDPTDSALHEYAKQAIAKAEGL